MGGYGNGGRDQDGGWDRYCEEMERANPPEDLDEEGVRMLFEELKAKVDEIAKMLEEPELGLSSWHLMLGAKIDDLTKAYYGLGDDQIAQLKRE